MMEAVQTSETVVNLHQSTRHCNPEDIHLHTQRRENLKSYSMHLFNLYHNTYLSSTLYPLYLFTSGLFNNAVSISEYTASNDTIINGNELEGCVRKWTWYNLSRFHTGTSLKGLRKTKKTRQCSQCPGQEMGADILNAKQECQILGRDSRRATTTEAM
jgi:hypothetical protein